MARPKMPRLCYVCREDPSVYVSTEGVEMIVNRIAELGLTKASLWQNIGNLSRNELDKLLYHPTHHIRLKKLAAIVSYLEMKVLLQDVTEEKE